MQTKDEEYYTKKLFEYAQSANFEGVKHVIALGADFNAFYGDYLNDRNVLMDASKAGSLMIVKFLIEDCGVEPSLYPEWHFFIEACKSGNLELVKYIHKLGAAFDVNDWDCSYNPAMAAIYFGHTHILDYLLSNGIDVHKGDRFEESLLPHAYNNLDAIKLMIEKYGADVNLPDEDNTLLHNIVSFGNFDTLKYVVENYSPNLFIKDMFGKTLLEVAQDIHTNQDNHFFKSRTKEEDLKIINYLKDKLEL